MREYEHIMLGTFKYNPACKDRTDELPPDFRAQLKRPAYIFFAIAAVIGVVVIVLTLVAAS